MNGSAALDELMQRKRTVESLLGINTAAGSNKSAEIERMLKIKLSEIIVTINGMRSAMLKSRIGA